MESFDSLTNAIMEVYSQMPQYPAPDPDTGLNQEEKSANTEHSVKG